MRLEIYNGEYVGAAEWRGPGEVALDMQDEGERAWFERYFAGEDAYMDGPVECAEMSSSRRDASPAAFEHAAFRLAAYAYEIKRGDGRRTDARNGATRP
ncbi:MAG: hypothetical protein ACRDG9_12760 [Actinomycetota bacterium]